MITTGAPLGGGPGGGAWQVKSNRLVCSGPSFITSSAMNHRALDTIVLLFAGAGRHTVILYKTTHLYSLNFYAASSSCSTPWSVESVASLRADSRRSCSSGSTLSEGELFVMGVSSYVINFRS